MSSIALVHPPSSPVFVGIQYKYILVAQVKPGMACTTSSRSLEIEIMSASPCESSTNTTRVGARHFTQHKHTLWQ